MPYIILRNGDDPDKPYCVYNEETHDRKGCHSSYALAQAQISAIGIHTHEKAPDVPGSAQEGGDVETETETEANVGDGEEGTTYITYGLPDFPGSAEGDAFSMEWAISSAKARGTLQIQVTLPDGRTRSLPTEPPEPTEPTDPGEPTEVVKQSGGSADEEYPEDDHLEFVMQAHGYGESVHADFRAEYKRGGNRFLRGFGFAVLREDALKDKGLTSAEQLGAHLKDLSLWKINWDIGTIGDRKVEGGVSKRGNLRAFAKTGEIPVEWLTAEGKIDSPDPGDPVSAGATTLLPGFIVIADKGEVVWGAQKPDFKEWFLYGDHFEGRYVFRMIGRQLARQFGWSLGDWEIIQAVLRKEGQLLDIKAADGVPSAEGKPVEPSYWILMQPLDQTPYVLGKEAIRKHWLPPKGVPCLPREVLELVPDGLKFWEMEHHSALAARDELAEQDFVRGFGKKEGRHRKDHCMSCTQPPTISVLWAEGHGLAWFCVKCYKEWKTEHPGDVCSEHELKEGEDPTAWREKKSMSEPPSDQSPSNPGGEDGKQEKAVTEVDSYHFHALDSLSPQGSGWTEPFAGEDGHKHEVDRFSVKKQESHSHHISESTRHLFGDHASHTKDEGVVRRIWNKVLDMLVLPSDSGSGGDPKLVGNMTLVTKQQSDGRWRWAAVSSTAFLDGDEEIVGRESIRKSVARASSANSYGPMRFWHKPGIRLGECDFQAQDGLCLVESGLWDDSPIGEAARKSVSASPEKWAMSIGFLPIDSREGIWVGGVFVKVLWEDIQIVERSLLYRPYAASPFTRIGTEVRSKSMALNDVERGALNDLLGEKLADEVLGHAERVNRKAQEAGAVFKGKSTEGEGDTGGDATGGFVDKLGVLATSVKETDPAVAEWLVAFAGALKGGTEPAKKEDVEGGDSKGKAGGSAQLVAELKALAAKLEGDPKTQLLAIVKKLEAPATVPPDKGGDKGGDNGEADEDSETKSIAETTVDLLKDIGDRLAALDTEVKALKKDSAPKGASLISLTGLGPVSPSAADGDADADTDDTETKSVEAPRAVQAMSDTVLGLR